MNTNICENKFRYPQKSENKMRGLKVYYKMKTMAQKTSID
jgi:hypothetical protein